MIQHGPIRLGVIALVVLSAASSAIAGDLFPAASAIQRDRPRVLLRVEPTPHAISQAQLKAIPRDATFRQLLAQLRGHRSAAAQAMVWQLTGERAAAEKAIARMRAYRFPGNVDTFHTYFTLREFGLAYDWLYDYAGFSREKKAEVRGHVLPLAKHGMRVANDHMFHNYIWMSAGGAAIWALATVGEDEAADGLYEQVARRFNRGLFPAMQYLDGLPSEPMGYWALYDLSPAALTLLAAQSASETDLVGRVKTEQHDWLNRHFQNLIHSTLPDMRYVPWGDLQSGPNGGVTHEMAGVIDALAWALDSPEGAHFSNWLAEKRGSRRFDGENAVFYMLYTRNVSAKPRVPPLSFTAGNQHSGRLIARSDWTDNATIVTLTATDHFGDHNHYDQGSFVIYRNGLLAVDPPVYRKIRGPQQLTENHNTLLIGGQAQRTARGQSFTTVEAFRANLDDGKKLETGNMLFQKDAGPWAAAAVQFAQAYSPETVRSCVRQLLFIRPGKIVVVDRLTRPPGSDLPQVQWLLQLPREPEIGPDRAWANNGKSWLRCRSVLPGGTRPTASPTEVNTHRVSFTYRGNDANTLVHVLDVGDGLRPDTPPKVAVRKMPSGAVVVELDGREYTFRAKMPFGVTSQ